MASDPEPDETRLLRTQDHMGTVQRWDQPDGLRFRLDLWRTSGTDSPADFLYEKSGDNSRQIFSGERQTMSSDDERDDDETETDPDAL